MRAKNHTPVTPYVVYVTYPGNPKEYAYACDIPGIHRGAVFRINGAGCTVQSVEHRDPGNLKWVPGSSAITRAVRIAEINRRLHDIEKQELLNTRWSKLKSPEAKRLVKELKELTK